MGKRGKNQKKSPQISKKDKLHSKDANFNHMDDEIDAFHKKRDMVPLNIDDDDIYSDEDDDEQPVFGYEGIDGDESDGDNEEEGEDEDEEDDAEDDEDDDETNLKGFVGKLARQQKYMREKVGGVDDEVDDDAEDEEKKHKVWSRGKSAYYGTEEDYELMSSGDESPAEEEEEVIKMQKERAESLRAEDFGLQDDELDESDQEPTMEEMMLKGKPKSSSEKEAKDDVLPMYEEVKKDLSALSREEQMDVVYSLAPELVGLLAELNDATKQLETHVNPLLSKVRKGENAKKGLHYLEVKQLLLLAYCQAIIFYLLLKSEGQPVRDHPVISRLVEIKSLLDKMKELDGYIPDGLEDVLLQTSDITNAPNLVVKGHLLTSDVFANLNELSGSTLEKQKASKLKEATEPVEMQSVEVNEKKRKMDKRQDLPVSSESLKMLQYRTELEEKLKLKAGSVVSRTDNIKNKKLKKIPGKLETTDDFDDDAMGLEGTIRDNRRASTLSSKLSQIVPSKGNVLKGVSGDDDLPERDDLGDRRLKHELRVLARAGLNSNDYDDAQIENGTESLSGNGADAGESDEGTGSEDYYNLIKQQREAKLKIKAQKYSRDPQVEYEPETNADGKRHITTQMEKNRGLTRDRKKQIKNPRKKYKLKHKKAVNSRKGQVRDIRRPKLTYDGETTGINPRISRSTRF